jgi:2-oxoglutarate ferredoxin oxidoreductase subunit beta
MEKNVVISGIGCSGNLVHLLEGDRPYGFHGIHGRTLPIAMGTKMAQPELNVVVVAGDGDFLSIGMEHISPQAARNLDVCVVIMDNAVYGLTKGQASPTTLSGVVTPSTPFGKMENEVAALDYYLSIGVTYIASGFSGKPRDLSKLITAGMEHEGFSIVHVQSPCTTYNDTFEALKGSVKKGIDPVLFDVPEDHDPADRMAAYNLIHSPGIPVGLVYEDTSRPSLTQRLNDVRAKVSPKSAEELLAVYEF